jgi:hypothetical protein
MGVEKCPRPFRSGPALLVALLLAAPRALAIEEPMDDREVPVEIDFEACEPKQERMYVPFGSTMYEIVGMTEKGCHLRYGGEVENRTWDGALDHSCYVPPTLGLRQFRKTGTHVDFSVLDAYCSPSR